MKMKTLRASFAVSVAVALAAGVGCSSSSDAPLGTYAPDSGDGTSSGSSGTSGSSGSSGTSGSSGSSGGSSGSSSGSSGSSSGSSGDAGTDSGSDSGSVSCTGLAWCDDFEAYTGAITNGMTVGPWKATVSGTGTVVAVDTTKPHSGTKSLHITIPAGPAARGTLHQASTAASGLVTNNNLFGRAMVFYSSTNNNDLPLAVHSWLFAASGKQTETDGGILNMNLNMGGGGAKMQLNYSPTDNSVQGGTMTAGAWHCVQWQYDAAGTPPANTAKVWVDGAVAIDIPATKGWIFATPWSAFDFGFTHYQTLAKGVDVYLDDFALNDAMIACP